MKKILSALVALLSFSSLLSAFTIQRTTEQFVYGDPWFEVGELFDFYFDSSVYGQYESNVFRDEVGADSDFLVRIRPGLEVVIGSKETTLWVASLRIFEDFYIYSRNTMLNHEDFSTFFTLKYEDCRLNLTTHASYIEREQNTPDENIPDQLVVSDSFSTGINLCYHWSPRSRIDVGANFDYVDYDTTGFVDRTSYHFPIALLYEYSPTTLIGPAYYFRHFNVCETEDFNDHFVGISIRGEFSHKLCWKSSWGAVFRDGSDGSSTTTTGTQGSIQWMPSHRHDVYFDYNRRFVVSGFGSSILSTGVALTYTYHFNEILRLNAFGSFNNADYRDGTNREDNSVDAKIDITRRFGKCFWFTIGYQFSDNDSNIDGSSFTNNTVFGKLRIRF